MITAHAQNTRRLHGNRGLYRPRARTDALRAPALCTHALCAPATPNVGESMPEKWMWLMCTSSPTIAACGARRQRGGVVERASQGAVGAGCGRGGGWDAVGACHGDTAVLELGVPEEGERAVAANAGLRGTSATGGEDTRGDTRAQHAAGARRAIQQPPVPN